MTMIAARPLLGWGLGCFPVAFPAFQPDSLCRWFINHAHNDYLELTAETGIIGLFAALLVVSVLFISCMRKLKHTKRRELRMIGIGALAGCFSLLVHSVMDFNFHIPFNAMLFAVLKGVETIPV
ncbi:MAG: O-antigen ligase family protein [Candidatus Electrothrix gigas]